MNKICNLIPLQAIQYLSADYHPTAQQSSTSITSLVRALEPYGLTKAEKLQIVNLAPTEAVELYVIVEELEDRLGERMEEVLQIVRQSLSERRENTTGNTTVSQVQSPTKIRAEEEVYDEDMYGEEDADAEEFDDSGEGAGVEGDLEMDDD